MLTFTHEQLDALHDAMDERFQARLVEIISRLLPDPAGQPGGSDAREQLNARVLQARERAAQLQIIEEADVAVFVALLIASSGFGEEDNARFRGWLSPFLRRPSSPGKVRMALIERSLKARAAEHPLAARLDAMAGAARASLSAGVT